MISSTVQSDSFKLEFEFTVVPVLVHTFETFIQIPKIAEEFLDTYIDELTPDLSKIYTCR